jgi:hypothetical protein
VTSSYFLNAERHILGLYVFLPMVCSKHVSGLEGFQANMTLAHDFCIMNEKFMKSNQDLNQELLAAKVIPLSQLVLVMPAFIT